MAITTKLLAAAITEQYEVTPATIAVFRPARRKRAMSLAFLFLNTKTGTLEKVFPGDCKAWCENHHINYNSLMCRRNLAPERDLKLRTINYAQTPWVCIGKDAANSAVLAEGLSILG